MPWSAFFSEATHDIILHIFIDLMLISQREVLRSLSVRRLSTTPSFRLTYLFCALLLWNYWWYVHVVMKLHNMYIDLVPNVIHTDRKNKIAARQLHAHWIINKHGLLQKLFCAILLWNFILMVYICSYGTLHLDWSWSQLVLNEIILIGEKDCRQTAIFDCR